MSDAQAYTMVCPDCGVWRTLDVTAKVCLDCGRGQLLHACPRCNKRFQQLSGRYHNCGERVIRRREGAPQL